MTIQSKVDVKTMRVPNVSGEVRERPYAARTYYYTLQQGNRLPVWLCTLLTREWSIFASVNTFQNLDF